MARDAGVTTAALYHYMGGKQDLLLTIMRDGMHGLLAEAREALEQATTPREELAALARVHIVYNGHALLDAYVGDTEIRSLDDANRARVVKLRDDYEELWADVIRRGVESRHFRINDEKLFRLAAIQMVNGVAYWYRPSGGRSLTAIADEFAGFVLAMADPAAEEEPAARGNTNRRRRARSR